MTTQDRRQLWRWLDERFIKISNSFSFTDLMNPVTAESFTEATRNVREEMKLLEKEGIYGK